MNWPNAVGESERLRADDCLDFHDGHCHGDVEYRVSLSGTGTRIPRCDHHWDLRVEQEGELRERYPDSDSPPAWFDEANAGERWNEDD